MELDARVCDRARLARDARFDGQFFIAVRSTGIYCRPICPSRRARRENVRYFRSGEEAVAAGFRACLRCRPEAAPGTPAWKGASTTVGRALRLIAEGALQEQSLAVLSRRLGVSTRHLDRLFQTHLGASPAAVARTVRVQFARDLIRETDLPMNRVAEAAGFRSVRRFNDSIRRLTGRTPSELRRLRPVSPTGRPDEYVFHLPYRAPYDWESLLAFLETRAIPGVEEVVSGVYRRTFSLDGKHGVLEVRHGKRRQALEARVRFPRPVSLLPIVTRVRAMFDVAANTTTIGEHFRRDPLLRRLVKKYPGLRVPGAWDPFELAVRAILGQQVTVKGASTLAGRLARRLGKPLSMPDAGGLTVLFPTAEVLARTSIRGLTRARALAIRSLAQAVVSGRVSLTGDHEALREAMGRVRGIGEWTVEYVAMRALREPDAFPANDLALLRSCGDGSPLTAPALRERAERWRPWRAYAAVHLWRGEGDEPAAAGMKVRAAGSGRRS